MGERRIRLASALATVWLIGITAACGLEESTGEVSPVPGGKLDGVDDDGWQMTPAEAIAVAEAVSERCREAPCLGDRRVTFAEMLTLFAAAEAETAIPARLLKAIAFGEAYGVAYPDRWPRHFIDVDVAQSMEFRARWAWNLLRVDLPVVMGDDRPFGSMSYGLGIMQLTAPIEPIKISLAEKKKARDGKLECGKLRYHWQAVWDFPEITCRVVPLGGGRPDYWYNHQIDFDTERSLVDPYYNILIGAQFIRFKQEIFGLPERPAGPLWWISMDPDSEPDPDMAWALIGSIYQTRGGYGPGGGATLRIYHRMTNPEWDAWHFVSSGPALVEEEPP